VIVRSARRWLFVLAVLFILAVATFNQRQRFLPQVAHWLDVGQAPTRTDYVMVLPGHSETRPFVAASCVRLGLADRVLVPRARASNDTADGIVPPSHDIVAAVMECRGISSEKVVILPGESGSTFDDATALATFLETQPAARVTIVTNGFHTRRARWIFRQRIPTLMGRLHFVSAPYPNYEADRWWCTAENLDTVCSEYLKLLFYWCKYGNGLYWLGAAFFGVVVLTWFARIKGCRPYAVRPNWGR